MTKLLRVFTVAVFVASVAALPLGCKKEEPKGPLEKLGEKMDKDLKKIDEKAKEAKDDIKKAVTDDKDDE